MRAKKVKLNLRYLYLLIFPDIVLISLASLGKKRLKGDL